MIETSVPVGMSSPGWPLMASRPRSTPAPPPPPPSPWEALWRELRIAALALPCWHLRLSARKPLPPALRREPRTLGEHLRRARVQRGLKQGDVANEIGVGVRAVIDWELGYRRPPARFIPRITAFLGYCPWKAPEHAGERLRITREALGLCLERAAAVLGVGRSTADRWERGRRRPPASCRRSLLALLAILGE